ncbi:hypothetical protein H5410_021926 [Solanum commersonii]|uniref:Uncharacterized protein n=1 Tax=Solanum commersonii TaxID=4109 RepID=A0A9J5ZDX5_SOLCO|nr:hypothetical protein H5410_021926 [Solanum commersonii]
MVKNRSCWSPAHMTVWSLISSTSHPPSLKIRKWEGLRLQYILRCPNPSWLRENVQRSETPIHSPVPKSELVKRKRSKLGSKVAHDPLTLTPASHAQ